MNNKALIFIAARLKERSTYLGLIALASAAGYSIDKELLESIILYGSMFSGIILALTEG